MSSPAVVLPAVLFLAIGLVGFGFILGRGITLKKMYLAIPWSVTWLETNAIIALILFWLWR